MSEISRKSSTRRIVFAAVGIALAFVTSLITVFKMPFGGNVTLLSMLFIVLIANWYGTRAGIISGLIFGILQFVLEPVFLSPLQVCFDYLMAYSALGLAGLFSSRKHGLVVGYIVGISARALFSSLAGYFYWMDYMPDNFPRSIAFMYPIIYNYGFIYAEGIVTLIVICIPAVSNGIARMKLLACGADKGLDR